MTPDPWAWWRAQLAGENPEATPGTPHNGYYRLRKWVSDPTRPGKRVVKMVPIALWQHELNGWLIASDRSGPREINLNDADDLFASCCRNAIPHDEYEREVYGDERLE